MNDEQTHPRVSKREGSKGMLECICIRKYNNEITKKNLNIYLFIIADTFQLKSINAKIQILSFWWDVSTTSLWVLQKITFVIIHYNNLYLTNIETFIIKMGEWKFKRGCKEVKWKQRKMFKFQLFSILILSCCIWKF